MINAILSFLLFLLVAFAFIVGFVMCCIEEPAVAFAVALAIVFLILANLDDNDDEY